MAARDILALNNSIAPRMIRCLYIVALILIALMTVVGIVRGVRVMTRPPLAPVAMTSNEPDASIPPSSEPAVTGQGRMMEPRRMAERRFLINRDLRGPGRLGLFGINRNPVLAGGLFILGVLVRGIIVLMIVRILAEIGLAMLATPRRSDS